MNLSKHFTLEELIITQQRGVDNTPSAEVVEHLRLVAETLERVRVQLEGRPILVSSGYRSAEVNRRVGGSSHSAHLLGYAADFICPGFGSPVACARRIDASGIGFDQLIYEGTWVHLSVDPRMRREALTAFFGKEGVTYRNGIIGD